MTTTGHGHVRPRADGTKMRCGGPGPCIECSRELALATNPPVMTPTKCDHDQFTASCRVARLTDDDEGKGPVKGYTCDLTITCVKCGIPFRFMGLAAGSHPTEPRVSVDGTVLRAPLEPAYVTELCGQPLVSGRA